MLDDRDNNRFPMPLDAMHQDNVYVGRIRCWFSPSSLIQNACIRALCSKSKLAAALLLAADRASC